MTLVEQLEAARIKRESLEARIAKLEHACTVGLQYIEAVCFNTPDPKKRKNYADAATILRAALQGERNG